MSLSYNSFFYRTAAQSDITGEKKAVMIATGAFFGGESNDPHVGQMKQKISANNTLFPDNCSIQDCKATCAGSGTNVAPISYFSKIY